MSTELLIANLLRVATEDLEGARLLASAGNRNAVYLCEQAAEKIIRAVVSSEGKHAGVKHDLAEIIDLIPDENPLKNDLRKIEHLSAYATSYRYPVSSSRAKRIPESPTSEALTEALDDTASALMKAATAFQVDLDKPNAAAKFGGPIRPPT